MDMDDEVADIEDFYNLGFEPIPHFTIGSTLTLLLTRGRHLSASCIGQGNESIWLCKKDNGEITDMICIHNVDYDGLITYGRLKEMVGFFEVMK